MKINKYFFVSIINIFLIIKPSNINFYMLSAGNEEKNTLKNVCLLNDKYKDAILDIYHIIDISKVIHLTNDYTLNYSFDNYNYGSHDYSYCSGSSFLIRYMNGIYKRNFNNTRELNTDVKHIFATGAWKRTEEENLIIRKIIQSHNDEEKNIKKEYDSDNNRIYTDKKEQEKLSKKLIDGFNNNESNIIKIGKISLLLEKFQSTLDYCNANNINEFIFCLPLENKTYGDFIFQIYKKNNYLDGNMTFYDTIKDISEDIKKIFNDKKINKIKIKHDQKNKQNNINNEFYDKINESLLKANKIHPTCQNNEWIANIIEYIFSLSYLIIKKNFNEMDNNNLVKKIKNLLTIISTLLIKENNIYYKKLRKNIQDKKIIMNLQHELMTKNHTSFLTKYTMPMEMHLIGFPYLSINHQYHQVSLQLYFQWIYNNELIENKANALASFLIKKHIEYFTTNKERRKPVIDLLTFFRLISKKLLLQYPNLENNQISFVSNLIESYNLGIISEEAYMNILDILNRLNKKNQELDQSEDQELNKSINLIYKSYINFLIKNSYIVNQINNQDIKKKLIKFFLLFPQNTIALITIKNIHDHYLKNQNNTENIDNNEILNNKYIKNLEELMKIKKYKNKKNVKNIYEIIKEEYKKNEISLEEFYDILKIINLCINDSQENINNENISEFQPANNLEIYYNQYLSKSKLWTIYTKKL